MVRNVPRGIGCRVLRSHHCLCIHTLRLTLVGGPDMHMEKSDRNRMVTRPAGARCPIVCWNAASSLNGCICILLLGDGCLYPTTTKVCICRCSGHLPRCLHLASTSLPSSPSSCNSVTLRRVAQRSHHEDNYNPEGIQGLHVSVLISRIPGPGQGSSAPRSFGSLEPRAPPGPGPCWSVQLAQAPPQEVAWPTPSLEIHLD